MAASGKSLLRGEVLNGFILLSRSSWLFESNSRGSTFKKMKQFETMCCCRAKQRKDLIDEDNRDSKCQTNFNT